MQWFWHMQIALVSPKDKTSAGSVGAAPSACPWAGVSALPLLLSSQSLLAMAERSSRPWGWIAFSFSVFRQTPLVAVGGWWWRHQRDLKDIGPGIQYTSPKGCPQVSGPHCWALLLILVNCVCETLGIREIMLELWRTRVLIWTSVIDVRRWVGSNWCLVTKQSQQSWELKATEVVLHCWLQPECMQPLVLGWEVNRTGFPLQLKLFKWNEAFWVCTYEI